MNDRTFHEWFHAEWLKARGPVNPESTYGRLQHRECKQWAEAAWLEATMRSVRERATIGATDKGAQTAERGGILRELAKRATPGPWTTLLLANGADVRAPHASGGSTWVAETRCNDDAAYIAAANPATILSLLDALDDAHASREPS